MEKDIKIISLLLQREPRNQRSITAVLVKSVVINTRRVATIYLLWPGLALAYHNHRTHILDIAYCYVRIGMVMGGWRILKVTLPVALLLGFLLVASGADASPRNPEVFVGRHQKLHSDINETTTNLLIRGFIDHVSPRVDSGTGAADPTYVSSSPSYHSKYLCTYYVCLLR